MQGVYEPSDGSNPNNGPGTATTEQYGRSYADADFGDLCGPGAADVALEYWPSPPNLLTTMNVTDTAHTGTVTSWNSNRMRGYMTYLAWQLNWHETYNSTDGTPWHVAGQDPVGMMDSSRYTSWGVTLYGMDNALNWAASGESSSTWLNYFYIIAWKDQQTPQSLHDDVVSDVYTSHVPVVAEVDPTYLNTNWTNTYHGVHHFITIIGYDDIAGKYEYTDTCGTSTHRNYFSKNSDNSQPYYANQADMWMAINSIKQNQSTAPSGGDGGWVW